MAVKPTLTPPGTQNGGRSYTLNQAQVAIKKFVVSLQSGKDSLVWSFEIDSESSSDSSVTVTPVEPLPTEPKMKPKLTPKAKPSEGE